MFLAMLALLLALAAPASQAYASELPLPKMAPCVASSPPLLPEKWRGAYLMAPFTRAQLMLSDIVSDSSLAAMRVKLLGMRSGSLDLLIIGRKTYLLTSERECKDLG